MTLALRAHHISFPVTELARSRKFYEGVLGLEPIPRPELGSLGGAWYRAGSCEVHLIEAPSGVDVGQPPAQLNPLARHAAFAVADYDAALEQLQRQGLKVVESRAAGQMWVQDPDGHVLELIVPSGS